MYLCLIDYDKTLINDNNEISNVTKSLINDYINSNNKFCIISTELYDNLKTFVNKYNLNIDFASISSSSYFINNIEVINNIKKEFIIDLENKFKNEIYTAYGYGLTNYIFKYQDRLKNMYPTNYNLKILNDFNSYFLAINIDISKEIEDFIINNNYHFDLIGKDKNREFLLIKPVKFDKSDIYNILINTYKNKKTIGIGNSYSDYDFIKYCDIKIAMKNSDLKLIESASYVTDFDNNNDGALLKLNDICHFKKV